jgi:hypothetical protein
MGAAAAADPLVVDQSSPAKGGTVNLQGEGHLATAPPLRHADPSPSGQPGDRWTFAIRVVNDGAVTDDIRVTARPTATNPVPVRYFFSFFDIGPAITGDGFVLTDMQPGEARLFAVRFEPAPDAAIGSRSTVLLSFTSVRDPATAVQPRTDGVVVSGLVAPPP